MLETTPKSTRQLVVAIIVIAAILMIVLVPFLGFDMVNPIVKYQQARIAKFTAENNPQAPLLTLTVWLVSFFYPFWSTLSCLAGIALLCIVKPFYEGQRWTRALALVLLAIPSIGGAYMIVPWMNFVMSVEGGFPPAVWMMMIGLIPYFAIILLEKVDLNEKIADALVLLLLGVTAAESFANGHASFRILYGDSSRPLFGPNIGITFFSWLGLWVGGWVLCTFAIYAVAARKISGWYMTLIAGFITLLASSATHYVRHTTNDYLYNALMGAGLVFFALFPYFKKHLWNKMS